MIGQSPRRTEDERLVAGRGRFVADIRLPGLLHLVLVRSTHARARLVRVDLSAARAWPGVAAFAGDNLPELGAPLPTRSAESTNPYVVAHRVHAELAPGARAAARRQARRHAGRTAGRARRADREGRGYRLPAFRAEAVSVVTNKVPSSPYRGAGRPKAVFVIERLLDRLARRLGMDPAEIRLKNLVQPSQMPYAPGLVYRDGVPVRYDGGDYPLELRRALDLADDDGWRRRRGELRREGRHVGLGIAAYLEAGGGPNPGEWATVKVDDRGQVVVSIGVSASGQGHETVFAQVCAEYLGARFEDIRVRGGDTNLVPHGYGTDG